VILLIAEADQGASYSWYVPMMMHTDTISMSFAKLPTDYGCLSMYDLSVGKALS
jgi:hypothetical protein